MSGLYAVGSFLLSLAFSLLTTILWIRVALRYYRIPFTHSFAQAIQNITQPIVNPVNQLFKSLFSISRIDWYVIILIAFIHLIKFYLFHALYYHDLLPVSYAIIYTCAAVIIEPCNLMFYAILFRVIIEWVNPQWNHDIMSILHTITNPVLKTARSIFPPIAGMDFSPAFALILLKVVTIFISTSLPTHLL